jgi:hypothetical protein
MLWSVVQDARYSTKMLRRNPGFALTAVLTLALGIGLNTTLFTALNAVAFHPLPVRDGDRLVRLERWFASEGRGDIQFAFSEAEQRYLAAQGSALTELIAAGWPRRVAEAGGERPLVQFVSPNYFAALGVVPAAGGLFGPAADASATGVVLSHGFWKRRYDGDPSIAGRTIALNGAAFTILGVTPASFVGTANPPAVPDLWAPIAAEERTGAARALVRRFQLLGHVRSGVTIRAAEAQLSALAHPLAERFYQRSDDRPDPERASYFGETNDPRFGACGRDHGDRRSHPPHRLRQPGEHAPRARHDAPDEIGMRLALGASRARIVRQLLTEPPCWRFGGAGLLLSLWAARGLWLLIAEPVQMFAHGDVTPLVGLTPDARVFAFTCAASILAAATFGLLPAARASRPDLMATLKGEAALLGRGMRGAALRRWFVGGQVAVSMALLLAAGLLLRGLAASATASTGYETAHVFDVTFERGQDAAGATRTETGIAAALSRVPRLSVALADRLPLAGTWTPPMTADGPAGRIAARTLANRVSPEYFSTLGVPVVRGRAFRRDDRDAAVAIVSEAAARLFWPDQDPLGRSFTLDMNFRGQLSTFEVIGVARDVRTANLSRLDPSYVYLPLAPSGHDHLMVRAAMAPRDAAAAIRATVGAADGGLLADLQITSLDEGPLRLWKAMIRTLATFAGALALIALSLATGGVYGVVGYLAASRRHEIGVRMALGASRADVLWLVLTDGLGPVALGAMAGLSIAVILSALVRSSLSFPGTPDMLFGVSAFDLVTFGAVTAVMAFVTLVASAGPLWRATRVDPVVALRQT